MTHPAPLASLEQWSIACGASGDLIVDYHPDTRLGPYVQVDVPTTSHASFLCNSASRTTVPASLHHAVLLSQELPLALAEHADPVRQLHDEYLALRLDPATRDAEAAGA